MTLSCLFAGETIPVRPYNAPMMAGLWWTR